MSVVKSISSHKSFAIPNIYSYKENLAWPNLIPIEIYRCLKNSGKISFLMEFNLKASRIAVICCDPLISFSVSRNQKIECMLEENTIEIDELSPIDFFREIKNSFSNRFSDPDELAQSIFTIFSYDAAKQFEKKIFGTAQRENMPDIWAIVPKNALILNLDTRECSVIANSFSLEDSIKQLKSTVLEYSKLLSSWNVNPIHRKEKTNPSPRYNVTKEEFIDSVNKAKEYIKAGDAFQVVLSIESELETELLPVEIYRKITGANLNTANYLIETPKFSAVGTSPEILVEKIGERCLIRPLAGTIHHIGRKDEKKEQELLNSEKNCSEHRMLVDLARNDLGRVCKWGTVLPSKLMDVEYYNNVMHIVSEIEGRIEEKYDEFDLFKAGFPAGTMTGAPKIRAMEIIDELENTPRGFYSGGIGFFTPNGNLYSYINIRSMTLIDGIAYARAGAGIVYDSIPEQEYNECLNKLENALMALREGERNDISDR